MKTALSSSGTVKSLDQDSFDDLWMRSPQFHALVDNRQQKQLKFQAAAVIQEIELLKPEYYLSKDLGLRGCHKNRITHRVIEVFSSTIGPRGYDYSYTIPREDYSDEYRKALRKEIAFQSNIKIPTCVIL